MELMKGPSIRRTFWRFAGRWRSGRGGPADAGSLVRTGAPVLDAGTHLTDALKLFEQTHLPAFPVVWKNTGRLDGVLYRNALFQVITEMMKRESGGDVGM